MHVLSEHLTSQIRDKIRKYAWAEKVAGNLKQMAENFIRDHIELPIGPAEHDLEYHCPDCGTFLALDPHQPHRHLCIFCGKTFSGKQYDAAWRNRMHLSTSSDAKIASYAYVVQPSEELFNALKERLFFYARNYKMNFPEQGPEYSRGKVSNTGLGEAMWGLNMLWVYDAIGERLTETERNALRNDLFLPIAELLAPQASIIHNIHCWYLAAAGSIGAVFNEPHLVDASMNGPSGLYAQVNRGFYNDGLWYEGSPTYQFFTLAGLMQLIQFAHVDIKTLPDFAKYFISVWQVIRPDLVFPPLNDCYFGMEPSSGQIVTEPDGSWSLKRYVVHYEIATGLTKDTELAHILSALYDGDTKNRIAPEALFFGPEHLPLPAELPKKSIHMNGMGYSILRGEDRNHKSLYALLRFGQHGRDHEHFDKMQLILYGNDECVVPDLGAITYTHPLHRMYYKGSLGHNLVVVNQKDQLRSVGWSCYFVPAPFVQIMEAEEDSCTYDAITQNRAVLMTDSYILDYYQIRCPFQNTYDWIHHNTGELLNREALQPLDEFGDERYNTVFQNKGSFTAKGEWGLDFKTQNGYFRLVMMPDGVPTQVVVADAPYLPASIRKPAVIARRKTNRTVYLVLYEFYQSSPQVQNMTVARLPLESGWRIQVVCRDFTDTILFSRTYGKNQKAADGLTVIGKLGAMREYPNGERLLQIVDGALLESRDFKMDFAEPGDAVVKINADGRQVVLYKAERIRK